jgi:hypothetical protein
MGRKSVASTVRLISEDWKITKPIFVLESGVENPRPILDIDSLRFLSSVALTLHPVTFIYEFTKDTFYNQPEEPNTGRLISREGEPRREVVHAINMWMREMVK